MKPFAAAAVAIAALVSGGASASTTARAVTCPRNFLPLVGANPIAPATSAALAHAGRRAKPQVRAAGIASQDVRGAEVKTLCGAAVERATVIVYLRRRAYFPSESLMQGTYFVARFAAGYRVWYVAH
jgi:hypothetical protein